MKILMCTPRMSIGGAETHILSLSRALVTKGQEVTVASSGGLLVPELLKAGVRHIELPLDRKDPVSVLRCLAGLNRAARDCDIVHAHGRIPSFLCSVLSKRAAFPPFVTTAHGLYEPREPEKSLSRWGEGVIAVSRDVREYLMDTYGLGRDKIVFIPNGTEIKPSALSSCNPGDILAAGRLDRDNARQFSDILTAVSMLLSGGFDLHLTIAGDGNFFPELKKKADEINVNFPDSVRLCGPVADLSPLFDSCGIFIGQSRSAIEAMAHARPVLLFGNGTFSGTLTPENAEKMYLSNYIPAPCDNPVNELYNALKRLISDSEARRKAAGFSYGRVCACNDIKNISATTIAYYGKIIPEHRNAVMLCGYYGAHNLGDDATLEVLSGYLRDEHPLKTIYVITREPENVPAGCTGIGRLNLLSAAGAMRRCSAFILGGGSLLQNSTSNRSLRYYSALSAMAKRRGCPTEIYGGGIGPLRGKWAEKCAEKVLGRCSYAGLRDTASLEFAKRVTRKAELYRDPVLLYRDFEKKPPAGTFAVCLRSLSRKADRHSLRMLAEAVSGVEKESGLRPLLVVISAEDLKITRSLAALCGAEVFSPRTPAECASALSSCRFVIGMRLHSAVFASLSDVPAVCLSYDPKVSAFASYRGLPCFDAYTFTAEEILSACRRYFIIRE